MKQSRPQHHECSVDFCSDDSLTAAPFPICATHARKAYLFVADLLDAMTCTDESRLFFALKERDERIGKQVAHAASFITRPHEPVIYYVLVGSRIKIGTSTNLSNRLSAYPPGSELLATEPGGTQVEADRLSEFAEYLDAGREWFQPGPRLRDHIERLKAAT